MEAMGPSTTMLMVTATKEEDDHDHDHVLEQLPPGFRFHPTDEELIIHYLLNKVINNSFVARAIAQADLNKCEPWDLPKLAKMGENEWFFFCQRDRKYPTGIRTNRATQSGYWKATGKDREIHTLKLIKHEKCLVGMKKTLVFYKGRAPKGDKTNWVMHEYRLEGNFPSYNFSRVAKDSWVICKVFHKNTSVKRSTPNVDNLLCSSSTNNTTLPPLLDYSAAGCSSQRPNSSSATYDQPEFKYNNSELNPIFFSHVSPYNNQASNNWYQDYQNRLGANIPLNVASNIENFSSNNSVISHSQDTGISNEINSVHFEECKKPFEYNDYQEEENEIEGLTFSPNISDLDSLWRY